MSVDRIDPTLSHADLSNVQIVSWRYNDLKGSSTHKEREVIGNHAANFIQYDQGYYQQDSSHTAPTLRGSDKMDEKEVKPVSAFLEDAEVKVVWKEEERTKVGRGMIKHDDENFVYLSGEKGTVIVNKRDVIAIKQQRL